MKGSVAGETIRSGEERSFETSSVDVHELIGRANQATTEFGWPRWVPDPDDEIILWDKPPLTSSIVLQYANLCAWLEEVALTQHYIDAIRSKLRGVWLNASVSRNYEAVAEVLRDLFVWDALMGLRERDRETVRDELARTHPDPSRHLSTSPRVPDPKKEWKEEFGAGATADKESLLKPIPPFKLDP